MKKLLLSLAFAVGVLSASAFDATVTFSELGYTNAQDVTGVKVNDDVTLVFAKGTNSNAPKYYNTGTAVRLYGSNTLTFKGGEGVTLTNVEITTQSSNKIAAGTTVTAGALNLDADPVTWTGSANEFTLTEGGTSGHARITTIKVTYTGGTGTGEAGQVEVEPDPIETVKVANIKAFLDAANTEAPSEFEAPVTAVYQNGSYLYINDATGNLLVFGSVGQTYSNGDVIPAGIVGTYQLYNDIPQLASPEKNSFKAATAGTAVEPLEIGLDELGIGYANTYIVIKGVTIAKSDKNNTYDMTDANETTGVIYSRFTGVEIMEGSDLNVEGFVSAYGGVAQVYPTRVWSESGLEQVAAPVFNPASGTVEEGTEVGITCATEGATIYYTLDHSTPTAESTVYSAPFVITEATAIRAIAIKEGMEPSAVVDASYVVKKGLELNGDANFNFDNPTTLNPAQEAPTADHATGANLEGINFTDNGVTLVFNGGSTNPRLYYGYNTGVEARLYKTGTITITAPEGKSISKIEFVGNGIQALSYSLGETMTPLTEDSWTSTEGVQTAVFTAVQGQITDSHSGRVDVKGVAVSLSINTGIENLTEDANAVVEYFNLQGVRVQNPENGLYIRRQGNTVTKVLVK